MTISATVLALPHRHSHPARNLPDTIVGSVTGLLGVPNEHRHHNDGAGSTSTSKCSYHFDTNAYNTCINECVAECIAGSDGCDTCFKECCK